MILAALHDHYQRLLDDPASGISPPGYSLEKISFAIVLSADGDIVDASDLRGQDGKKARPRPLRVPQPPKRSSGIKAGYLWDKSSYVLGVSLTSKRCDQEHQAFRSLQESALVNATDPGLKALLAFLAQWTPEQFHGHPHLGRFGDDLLDTNLVFRLRGENAFLHEHAEARTAWQRLQGAGPDSARGICLVTGGTDVLARLHPSIKGVDGAQSSGASIVSFNQDAFESYGKAQGANAPIGETTAFAYTTALNHLLRRDVTNRQRLTIGDTTVIFWAQSSRPAEAASAEDLIAAFFGAGETDEQATHRLASVLQQVRQARPMRDLDERLNDDTRIFVLGLAPNASRLSIRFWESQTLVTFARRLVDHYDDLSLIPAAWPRAPTPRFLALQTAPMYSGKAKAEDVSPLLAGELTRAILTGMRYPQSLLSAIVLRFRSDGELNPIRVALCKGVLARDARLRAAQSGSTEERSVSVSLDPNNKDPGYLLGRLFSTLENVQRAALGAQINATIRDRYYGAASATPASVFPVLLRSAQNHLGKLRKEKPGLAVKLEKEIGQTIELLDAAFPRSLMIEAQGRFAIGYYHQTQARFARPDGSDAEDHAPEGESA